MALLVVSEEMGALQGAGVMMSISDGEVCTTEERGTVVQLPRRSAARCRAVRALSRARRSSCARSSSTTQRRRGDRARGRRRLAHGLAGRVRGDVRTERLGQDHAAAAGGGADRARRGDACCSTAATSATCPSARAHAIACETSGFVFQSFHLMPNTSALDNATIKLTAEGCELREARRRARPWLERLGLERACRTHARAAVDGRAPAGRDRPRARERAALAARRRADRQPRLPSAGARRSRCSATSAMNATYPGCSSRTTPTRESSWTRAYTLRDGHLTERAWIPPIRPRSLS